MKIPTTPVEGLFLKYFVLKMDDPDAVYAAMDFAKRKGNTKLLRDLEAHMVEVKTLAKEKK